jgi:hypothetical protein
MVMVFIEQHFWSIELPLVKVSGWQAMVLQWCCSGVTVVLQWCYSGVTVVLQWCYSGVTVVLQC